MVTHYIRGGVDVHTCGVYQCCTPLHIGWWFVCVHGREGWAPFSYLEPVHPDSGKGESNSEGSEEEDTPQVNYSNISKYGEYAHVYIIILYYYIFYTVHILTSIGDHHRGMHACGSRSKEVV